ncbi:MAG: polysaccharide deacetylase family protein [Gemmatimonadales bacterium]
MSIVAISRFASQVVLGLIYLAGSALSAQGIPAVAPSATWDVAITIDDVPMTAGGECTAQELRAVTGALLQSLRQADVVATAFVIPGTPCQGPGALSSVAIARQWREAGHAVGNHSWSHGDFNGVPATEYLRDVARADEALATVVQTTDQADRWYRPPLLHTGPTLAKQQALTQWLERAGYRMGVVTIDNQEWVFAAAYLRARQAGDDPLAARIVAAYLLHLDESVAYYRELSQRLFTRDVPQVLLLHANRLNADHLDEVLALLRRSGARFVPLRDALADPAYARPDEYVGSRGLSWLQRWAMADGVPVPPEPREPAWVGVVAQGSIAR